MVKQSKINKKFFRTQRKGSEKFFINFESYFFRYKFAIFSLLLRYLSEKVVYLQKNWNEMDKITKIIAMVLQLLKIVLQFLQDSDSKSEQRGQILASINNLQKVKNNIAKESKNTKTQTLKK